MQHDIMPHVAFGLVSVVVILWLGAWAHNAWHGPSPKPAHVAAWRSIAAIGVSGLLLWMNYIWLRRRSG